MTRATGIVGCALAGGWIALEPLGRFLVFEPRPGAPRPSVGRRDAQTSAPLTVEEYTPRSTLVVEEHPVPRAKLPGGGRPQPPLVSCLAARLGRRSSTEMDALNLQVLVNLSGGSGAGLAAPGLGDRSRERRIRSRMVVFANLDFSRGCV